ncbi:MAG: hypothetical protein ACI4D7_07440, partial [Lachnospiraceae bacterium]
RNKYTSKRALNQDPEDVKFLRKVSDSEPQKRAVPKFFRTALNMILSNCTKSRPLDEMIMEIAFSPDA